MPQPGSLIPLVSLPPLPIVKEDNNIIQLQRQLSSVMFSAYSLPGTLHA